MDDLAQQLINALLSVLPHLIETATDAMGQLLADRGSAAWRSAVMSLQQSDLNFLTRTPPGMSYNFGGVNDFLRQYDGLYFGVGVFAFTMLGLSSGMRMYFAWGWEIPETFVRVIMAIMLGTSAPKIYQVTIDLTNRICDAIILATLPSLDGLSGASVDPLTMGVAIVVWLVLGIRLLARMGYRIVYLGVIMIIGPAALAAWAIPGGDSYAWQWVRTYVGLLLGPILVCICLRLAGGIGGLAGASLAGLALGMGALLLAYDLATMYAEIRGGGLGGIMRQGIRLVARR